MTTTDTRPTMPLSKPDGYTLGATSSRPAVSDPATSVSALDGQDIPRGHAINAAPAHRAAGEQTTRPATSVPTPRLDALDGRTSSPAARESTTPIDPAPQGSRSASRQRVRGAQLESAAGSDVPDPATEDSTTPTCLSLLDPALALAADVLDDIERVRIANQNRVRQLTRVGVDADGEERGFGLDPDHPDVMRLGLIVFGLEQLEHDATLELQRKMRKHPLGAWVKAQKGVGDKQAARLLAAIGDPYVNAAKGTPRTVSALWAYCGLHVLPASQHERDAHRLTVDRNQLPGGQWASDAQDTPAAGDQHRDSDAAAAPDHGVIVDPTVGVGVAAKRRRGERANWSTKAKMRAYLVAESCMKSGKCSQCRDGQTSLDPQSSRAVAACACSPFRRAYDARRAHTAVTHPEWSDGHSHNDALRITAKEILKHLWRAARDWHLANGGAS